MRNLRKLTAAVLAIALVLTSMTATFAATTPVNGDKAVILKSLDLYAGKEATDPLIGLEDALTTEQSLTFLAKLFGYTAETEKLSDTEVASALAKFADADQIATYAQKIVAYSSIKGILSGSTKDGEFFVQPKDTVTAARFATFLLKQMGYVVPSYLDSAVQLSDVKGSKVSATETGDLTRDAAVGIMYATLTAEKANGTTVIADIVGTDAAKIAIATKAGLIVAPVTAEVVVDSVKAINTKQLEVTFNQAMDKDSAQTETFYEVKDKGTTVIALGADSAVLGADGKTVTITLDNAVTDKLTNSTTAKVKVKKDIKAASASKLAADKEFEVAVKDGIIPEVTKVEATGEYNIKVTFSEPVLEGGLNSKTLAITNFGVKSGTYTYYVQAADLNSNVINLTVGTKLIEGPVVVTVNAAGLDTNAVIQDYAGYKVFKGDTTFTYAKDSSVPVVTVKEAKPTSIKLGFSKPVKGADIKLYHSTKGASAYQSIATTAGKYVDEITFTYADTTNPVPAGTPSLFLVNSTSTGSELIDGYGIKVPDQTLTATIVVDKTGPVVSSTELVKNTDYKVTFDEEVKVSVANANANYTLKSVTDKKDVFFTAALDAKTDVNPTGTNKIVTINVPGLLSDNTQYELVVKKAEDLSGNTMTAEAAFTFTTGDNTAPSIKAEDCYAVAADGKIYITYSEPMNEAQMLDKVNYMVATNGAVFVALGSDDSVTKISDKVVMIDVATAVDFPSVKIAPIMDLAGKRLYDSVDSVTVIDIGGETVKISSADLTAKNKVKVVFNKLLNSFSNTDIVLAGTVTPNAIKIQAVESMVTNADGNSEVILVLDKELTTDGYYDGYYVYATTVATPGSVSVSGTKLAANQTIAINDKTAPEVVKYNHDDNASTDEVAQVVAYGYSVAPAFGKVNKDVEAVISITFSEEIDLWTVSTLSFKVDGYTVFGVDYDGNNVLLYVKANADNTQAKTSVTQAYNVADFDGNVFASGTTWTVR